MKHKLLPLSETMQYILLALREPLHGYAVMQKIEKISNGTVILAATAKGSPILKMEQNRLLHT